jgi:hypothetical protein
MTNIPESETVVSSSSPLKNYGASKKINGEYEISKYCQ